MAIAAASGLLFRLVSALPADPALLMPVKYLLLYLIPLLRSLIPHLRLTLEALSLRRHVTGSLFPSAPRGAVYVWRCGGP